MFMNAMCCDIEMFCVIQVEAIETELGHIACHIKGVDVCILCQKLSPGTGRTECRLVHRPHPLGCVYIHSFAWHARYMVYGVFFSLFLSTFCQHNPHTIPKRSQATHKRPPNTP